MAERYPSGGYAKFPFGDGEEHGTNPPGDCHGGGGKTHVNDVPPIVNTGVYTNTGATRTSTIDNQAGGTLTNSGALTATVSLSNEGSLTQEAGQLTTATFTNSGGLFLAGGALVATASATNTTNGDIAVSGNSSLLTPIFDNAGLTAVYAALRMDGAVDNQGTGLFLLQIGASVSGVTTFTNDSSAPLQTSLGIARHASFSAGEIVNTAGTISNAGSLQAWKIDNQAKGTLVNAGALTAWWSLDNEGQIDQKTGALTAGTLTNSASLFLDGGALSAVESATNTATGVVAVTGAASLLTPDYVNSGLTSVGGALTMNGAVDDEGKGAFLVGPMGSVTGVTTFTNDSTASTGLGIFTGASFSAGKIVNQAGTISNSGALTARRIDNEAGATLDNSGALTATKSLHNEGQIDQTAGALTTGKLTNSGDLFLAGGTLSASPSATNAASGVVAVTGAASLLTPDYVNSGLTSVGASLTMNGAVDNDGTGEFLVGPGGSVAGVTTFTNDSTASTGFALGQGAALTADTIVNAAGATLTDSGTLTATGTLDNEGTLTATGATLNVATLANDNSLTIAGGSASFGAVSGAGDLILNGDAGLAFTGTVGADQLLQFLKSGDSLTIADSGAAFEGSISGFAAGDQIVAAGVDVTQAVYTATGADSGTLTLSVGSSVYQTLHLVGADYSGATFDLAHNGSNSTVTLA